MSNATGHGEHHDNGMGHAVDWPILLGVWISLMVLTFITVAVTYVDLGPLNIVIAMGVATVKAALGDKVHATTSVIAAASTIDETSSGTAL